MERRPVSIYEWVVDKEKNEHRKVIIGIGVFLAFGIDYEQFDFGNGSYSTAIVEMPDGTVKNVPVENIKFIDNQ